MSTSILSSPSLGEFAARHIGVRPDQQAKMLAEIGCASLDQLIDAAVPEGIRSATELDLPAAVTEVEAAAQLASFAARNVVSVPLIGLGYHGTLTQAVIRRNVLEDPTWYTAYTPYQPEISQGRLEAKCEKHGTDLAAIMVTYPSTHGVYEAGITRLCELVHDHGGQVYVDGANLNALLGVAKPGEFGGDVSHLNLHKTFCLPHGGGGPGVGPVAVASHLAPYLPTHPLHPDAARRDGIGAVSAAPYGSAGILPIPWAYIRMMGAAGLTEATKVAVLSANYLAVRLAPHFPVLYVGESGLVAHECIFDLRPLTAATGVTVDDLATRLVDFGFHAPAPAPAPTMSFPVAGTLMVEPTESEDLDALDRFVTAMAAIRAEIDEVAAGAWPVEKSPLRRAPHTAESVVDDWDRPYSRERAAFPGGVSPEKYWPPVGRIEQAYGDRNLACSCPPITDFES